jgi:hypothetical protein
MRLRVRGQMCCAARSIRSLKQELFLCASQKQRFLKTRKLHPPRPPLKRHRRKLLGLQNLLAAVKQLERLRQPEAARLVPKFGLARLLEVGKPEPKFVPILLHAAARPEPKFALSLHEAVKRHERALAAVKHAEFSSAECAAVHTSKCCQVALLPQGVG